MVTNLPEEVKALWSKAIMASDQRVKLELLRQVYSKVPKHKGTENLLVNLRRQISNLEAEIEEQERKAKKKGSGGLEWAVRKTEFPQLCVVGHPDTSGRLFASMTGLEPDLYRLYESPAVGVYEAGDVPFQVVWTPVGGSVGRLLRGRVLGAMLNSDMLLLVAGPGELEGLMAALDEMGVVPSNEELGVEIRLTSSGGIIISGSSDLAPYEEVRSYLRDLRIYNAVVKLSRRSSLEDIEAALLGRKVKKYLIVGSYPGALPPEAFEADRAAVASRILDTLGLIRVYTKPPGGEVRKPPIVIERGAAVADVARRIHSELLEFFRFARLWREGRSQRVGLDYALQDGDVIEIRA